MTFARRQRDALVDLMHDVGPFAPTLCEGWRTQELAAHLYVREHRADALPGLASARFASRTGRIQTESLHTLGYLGLLEALRRPGWIMRPVDPLVNAPEYFIHHEDVLRANGGSQSLTAEEQRRLWTVVRLLGLKARAGFGSRVVVTRTDTGESLSAGRGATTLYLSGVPSELLLHLSGREANVELVGEPETVTAWSTAVGAL